MLLPMFCNLPAPGRVVAGDVSCQDAISVTATIMDTIRNYTPQFSDFINAISADSVKFPGSKYIINKILCRLYGP